MGNMNSSSVRVEFRPDGVAVLTIDQPGSKVNILTSELWTELESAIDALRPRTDVKGLVIASGKPGVFIAGADLKLLANAPGPNDPGVRAFIEHGLRVLEKLEALPFPTCAAIDGAALGGGLEVALACDYRIVGSHPKVQLGLPEVKLGLIPGWGGTQRLPRVADVVGAIAMLLGGESQSATDAMRIRLAMRAEGSLLEYACELAVGYDDYGHRLRELDTDYSTTRVQRLGRIPAADRSSITFPSEMNSQASQEAIRVMVEGAALPLYGAIKLETEAFMRLAGSPESKRLIAEFFATRKK